METGWDGRTVGTCAPAPNCEVTVLADAMQRLAEVDEAVRGDRVANVLQLMVNGEFVPGKTSRELATKWGSSAVYVSQCVTEAFGFLRAHRPGIDDDINRRLAMIEEDRRLARARVRHFAHQGTVVDERPDPDVKAMIAADRLYLETIGALIRTKETRGEEVDVILTLKAEIVARPDVARSLLSLIASVLPKSDVKQLIDAAPTDTVSTGGDDDKTS